MQHEGNVNDLTQAGRRVRPQAVLAEELTVIRGEDEKRVIEQAERIQLGQKFSNHSVVVADLAVI